MNMQERYRPFEITRIPSAEELNELARIVLKGLGFTEEQIHPEYPISIEHKHFVVDFVG
jgi:hypothetical protein